ncbi:hypothetical protein Tco_0742514 [Tanacetum coccineum]
MAKSNDLYDVKICVRSSVKFLGEIKDLLERISNRERLFRKTVFGLWLNILSHDNDNHLAHYVLQHQDSNPNLELYATPAETRKAWFIASIEFINGLVDEDMNVSQDDLQHNSVSANSVLSTNSHEGLNETRVGNNDLLLLEGGGVLDSKGCAKKAESDKDKQPTIAEVFAEVCALRKEVTLVKVNDARIEKLERLFNDPMFLNVIRNGNQKCCQPRILCCSCPDMDNGIVDGAGIRIHKADGKNDIPNATHNVVNQGLSGSNNDPMLAVLVWEFTRQMGTMISQTLLIMLSTKD